jgi:hypothetical protein
VADLTTLDLELMEIYLDVFEMPLLASHFMLNGNSPNCTEIPESSGRKGAKKKA